MCIAPSRLESGDVVACRNCWRCRANRVNDLVGRCIAESHTSQATLALTLTYKGDVVNSSVLVYKDVQDFWKRLRKAGYSVRYLVTGEYGSKKARAHWHAVLFFQGPSPKVLKPCGRKSCAQFKCLDLCGRKPGDLVEGTRCDWQHWQHGFSFAQLPDYGAFRYNLKYVLKDVDAEVYRTHIAMSKKPPLGAAFFMKRAQEHVEAGLSPRDARYSFRTELDAKGKRREFMLQGRMREIYIDAFKAAYLERHGTEVPFSPEIQRRDDQIARREMLLDEQRFSDSIEAKRPTRIRHVPDQTDWQDKPVTGERDLDLFGLRLILHEDDTITILKGAETWHVESEETLVAILAPRNGWGLSPFAGLIQTFLEDYGHPWK